MLKLKSAFFSGIILILLLGCHGAGGPQFILVNLTDQEYDLKLEVGSQVVFQRDKFPSDQAVGFLASSQAGLAQLKYKASVAIDWIEWQNSESKPYPCQLENGEIYLLLIEADGKAHFRKMNGRASTGPQVAFLNSTSRRFATVQVGKGVNENMQIYHQDLTPGMITSFYAIKPGEYPVFWQIPGRMDPLEAEYLINDQGDPLAFSFKPGHSYLFWISKPGASGKGAQLLDFSLLP